MITRKKLSCYINEAKGLENLSLKHSIKIAIMSSFTLNGLEQVLRVKCKENNINCQTYVSRYNQYFQEILNNKSEIYKFKPDLTYLILDTRTILGKLFFEPYSVDVKERKEIINDKIDEIINLINNYNENSDSKIILSNLSLSTYSPYGIFDNNVEFNINDIINEFNNKIKKEFLENSSVHIFDFDNFLRKYGENNVFDYKQYYFGDVKISLDFIPLIAEEFMSYVKPFLGINKKCIVLDLDNTLWGGILGEDGIEGIKLGDDPVGKSYVEFQKRILALHKRGIILAVNSRNNYEDVKEVFQKHPNMILKEEDFANLKINWNDKASNIEEIAKEINIGLDSMIFFDDDPINCELVKLKFPEINTINLPNDSSTYAKILTELNDFNIFKITNDDTNRGKMYLEQRKRTDFKHQVKDVSEFLKQLNICIEIRKPDKFTIPRISQLTLKTNQFNLSTKRFQEHEIKDISKEDNKIVKCVQVTDKFGDNGITSAYIISKENQDEWVLDTFLLSCRVMGRGVEEGILGYIINEARKEKIKKIKAKYVPTTKNKPIKGFLEKFGFKDEGGDWIYQVNENNKIPEHIEITIENE